MPDIIGVMSMIAYTVLAWTDSRADADCFEDWLVGGHIKHVLLAGAKECTLIRFDRTDEGSIGLEVRYMFGSRAEFIEYEDGPSEVLRAEGLAFFGPQSEHPMRFERKLGEVVSFIEAQGGS